MKEEPLDARSTGRKRARKVLFESGRPFICAGCDWVPEGVSPKGEILDPVKLTRSNNLDANHINKNILDNDPANLEWLCRTCHREKDRATDKGVPPVEDDLYGEDFFIDFEDLEENDFLNAEGESDSDGEEILFEDFIRFGIEEE